MNLRRLLVVAATGLAAGGCANSAAPGGPTGSITV